MRFKHWFGADVELIKRTRGTFLLVGKSRETTGGTNNFSLLAGGETKVEGALLFLSSLADETKVQGALLFLSSSADETKVEVKQK